MKHHARQARVFPRGGLAGLAAVLTVGMPFLLLGSVALFFGDWGSELAWRVLLMDLVAIVTFAGLIRPYLVFRDHGFVWRPSPILPGRTVHYRDIVEVRETGRERYEVFLASGESLTIDGTVVREDRRDMVGVALRRWWRRWQERFADGVESGAGDGRAC